MAASISTLYSASASSGEPPRLPSAACRRLSGGGMAAATILRFPLNFVRQLSTKARRNCSNISVVQIMVAVWSDRAAASSALAVGVGAPSPSATAAVGAIPNANVVQPSAAALAERTLLGSDASLAVHAGERLGRRIATDTITTPVANTSAYWFNNSQELIDFKEGRHTSFEYGRYGNPTTESLEKKMSALERAESTVFVASGIYASVAMLNSLVPAGGHIVTTTDCYCKTRIFMETELPKRKYKRELGVGVENTVPCPGAHGGVELSVFGRSWNWRPCIDAMLWQTSTKSLAWLNLAWSHEVVTARLCATLDHLLEAPPFPL